MSILNLLKNTIKKYSLKMRVLNRYRSIFGIWPNLKNPIKFNEKIQYKKVYDHNPHNPLLITCVDKVLVKKWVAQKIGREWIIPTIYSGKVLPRVEDRNWVVPFVIKANNASGRNYFIKSDKDLDWIKIEGLCNKWLKDRSYGRDNGEWFYSQIEPQILVEPFISNNENKTPTDYKVWVFNGTPKFVQVNTDREFDLKESFYDLDWNKMELSVGKKKHFDLIDKPKSLEKMLAAAKTLGSYFDFVRVDFYDVNKKPYFGELTFYPNAGYSHIQPTEWNITLGKFLES